jgi:hypothetical protein
VGAFNGAGDDIKLGAPVAAIARSPVFYRITNEKHRPDSAAPNWSGALCAALKGLMLLRNSEQACHVDGSGRYSNIQ